jgi:PBSX family phage terminase large subunit
MEVFKPHSTKQDLAIFSKKLLIILATGIQFGKTMAGAMRLKIAMHRYTDPLDAFICTAPTYKIMQQATLPAFLSVMKGYGEYHKGDAFFQMHNGGICYMRTATDPDSVVGITNVRSIWGDEAGLYPLYFHENLQARASFKQAPIIYTTSPYSLNWVYTDYIRKRLKNPEFMADEVDLIQASSKENPFFSDEEYERKRATMDPRRFNMVYGGEFNKVEGLVYDVFKEDIHVVSPETLPPGTVYVAGVDWGYTNPAVILVFGITPDGVVYLVNEFYKTQQTIADMVTAAQRFKKAYNIERFYCDPSSPANIAEFNKARLTAIPAVNDIRPGVDATYERMAAGKFLVFEGRAPNYLDEVSVYHYPADPDIHADKDIKELLPVKQYDHAQDAARYVCMALKLTGIKKRDAGVPNVANIDKRHHAFDQQLLNNLDESYDW